MSTHNIGFYEDLTKIIFELSSNTHLISSAEDRKITSTMPLIEPRHKKTCVLHICENKGTDQLLSNCAADQCFCFCYVDSIIPLLPKSKISCF